MSLELICSWCPCKGCVVFCTHYQMTLSPQPLCVQSCSISLLWCNSSEQCPPGCCELFQDEYLSWGGLSGVQESRDSSHTQIKILQPEDKNSEAWSSFRSDWGLSSLAHFKPLCYVMTIIYVSSELFLIFPNPVVGLESSFINNWCQNEKEGSLRLCSQTLAFCCFWQFNNKT